MMAVRFTLPLWPRCIGALMITASVATASASAQSLGDLARQEEARRKAIQGSGKVYTNDSVRSAPAPAPRPEASAPAPAPSPSGAQPPSPSGTQPAAPARGAAAADKAAADKQGTDQPKKDEKYWHGRIQGERDALQRAQVFAEALQSRINALSTDFVNRDDPAQRGVIATDRQKSLTELDRVKQEIDQHTKAIAAIQEEARRAGVPPGWLR